MRHEQYHEAQRVYLQFLSSNIYVYIAEETILITINLIIRIRSFWFKNKINQHDSLEM